MTERDYFIGMNMVKGLGSILFSRLIRTFGNPENVFKAEISRLISIAGINEKTAKSIKSVLGSKEFYAELEQIDKDNIEIITIEDEKYPALLKQIYDPPIVFYAKGSMAALNHKMVALVGCRKASSYGLKQAYSISRELANKGICIVSGMARGIDTQAHKGALAAKGKTVAVLGSGLNNIYPPENKGLYEMILHNGAVISEFSLNTVPSRSNFPRRNRIISGLCQAVVVIEAAQKSGSLITADLALNQGREVFAMPGPANSFNAQGTNKLIKEGAKLIENAQDVLDGLEVIWNF
jgi:DNA processing protein